MLRRTGKDGVPSLEKAVEPDGHDPVAQLEPGRALPARSQASVPALHRSVADRPPGRTRRGMEQRSGSRRALLQRHSTTHYK